MEEVYKQILDHYGADHQLWKAVEELSELTVMIAHVATKPGYGYARIREDIACEIADVEIMLEQVKLAMEISPSDIQMEKQHQLQRVLAMIKEEKK